MRYKFNRKAVVIGLGLFLLSEMWLLAGWNRLDDEELFQEAKILIFDKEWKQAQEKLDELLDEYPRSPYYAQALFYKGKCLLEQKEEDRFAIRVFQDYLERKDRNQKLVEEAEIAIIDLSFRLVERGRKPYAKEIEKRLSNPNRVVKYYAAIKMSFLEDVRIARQAVPVLQDILEKEESDDLRDRARIALLRIDPQSMDRAEKERPGSKGRILHLVIKSLKGKGSGFEIAIPWALADLALGAIPDEAKEDIRREGYNLDKIFRELNQFSGKVFEIRSEDSLIKIWIE